MKSEVNSGGGGGGGATSVYHRARLLAPIFPWLLFAGTAFPAATAGAAPVPAPSSLRGRSSPLQNEEDGAPPRRLGTTVQNYCGKSWGDANSNCLRPCPDGESTSCGPDEQCFADLSSCPSMEVLSPQEMGMPPPQPQSLGGGNDHQHVSGSSLQKRQ